MLARASGVVPDANGGRFSPCQCTVRHEPSLLRRPGRARLRPGRVRGTLRGHDWNTSSARPRRSAALPLRHPKGGRESRTVCQPAHKPLVPNLGNWSVRKHTPPSERGVALQRRGEYCGWPLQKAGKKHPFCVSMGGRGRMPHLRKWRQGLGRRQRAILPPSRPCGPCHPPLGGGGMRVRIPDSDGGCFSCG